MQYREPLGFLKVFSVAILSGLPTVFSRIVSREAHQSIIFMTSTIKKISIAILSPIVIAGTFAPVTGVFAAIFNTDAQDYPTLQVSNYTRNPGSNSHWASSVSANAGDIVSFLVYYHNTASDTANGTTLRVQLPSGSFTSSTATGNVQANNAPTANGTVSLQLSSGQTLTFIPGSVSWYPNKSASPHVLLHGQNGSEIVSGGLAVGDIAGGWASQGYVVFRAQVSNAGGNGMVANASAPFVTTNSAYSITQSSAIVQGAANPNNANATAWFEYGTMQSLGSIAGNQTVGSGISSTNISGYLYNLAPNTTYYYRAAAQNAYGTTYGSVSSFTTQSSNYYGSIGNAPLVQTNNAQSVSTNSAVFAGLINANNVHTNAWFEYGTTQSLGYTSGYQSAGSGNYASTFTSTVYNLAPNTTYYYRAVAQNTHGTTYGTPVSFITGGSSIGIPGVAPYVTTRSAQSVFRNSALIGGNINPNGALATAWFDWGTTTGLGNRTMLQPVGMANYASDYSALLSGLRSGTTYYYRAVSQNASGVTYGNIMNFTTIADPVVPIVVTNPVLPEPRVIVQQTSSGIGQSVVLIPSIDKKNPSGGDTITYSIQYRNETNSPVINAIVTVSLPSEVAYNSATVQPGTIHGNDLTFNLGVIAAHTQGVIAITAVVDRAVNADDTLLFGSTMTYTNAKKQFESTTTYLTVTVEAGVAGLASLLSVFGDLLTNWFVDLILGLLIGFGIYHFFVRQKEEDILIK